VTEQEKFVNRYMLSVIHPDGLPSVHDDVDLTAVFAAVDALNQRLEAEGRMVFATGLKSAASARTVHLEDDRSRAVVTDGPYVEAKEVLGGFWIIRATAEEIDDLAREAAMACQTTIEVRALEDEPQE
jgi:hypothetical protein